jgi:hypothetical protein
MSSIANKMNTDLKPARKPRAPMTEEAKAAMAAKRAATKAAAAEPVASAVEAEPKARKPREPLSDDAKAAMAAKRAATLAAKKAADGSEPVAKAKKEPKA